jgi:alkylhydroperoxidase family enzyme
VLHGFVVEWQIPEQNMARVEPLELESVLPPARQELQRQIAEHGRATNMKRTLAHSPTALHVYMHWYDLFEETIVFLGKRRAILFAHAISTRTDCLICSTFFRRWLAEAGDDPDDLTLDERDQSVIEYGWQLTRDPNAVSDELIGRLRDFVTPEQLVTLTAFGGLMIATNVFNNALRVDLDEYLFRFRKGQQQ